MFHKFIYSLQGIRNTICTQQYACKRHFSYSNLSWATPFLFTTQLDATYIHFTFFTLPHLQPCFYTSVVVFVLSSHNYLAATRFNPRYHCKCVCVRDDSANYWTRNGGRKSRSKCLWIVGGVQLTIDMFDILNLLGALSGCLLRR